MAFDRISRTRLLATRPQQHVRPKTEERNSLSTPFSISRRPPSPNSVVRAGMCGTLPRAAREYQGYLAPPSTESSGGTSWIPVILTSMIHKSWMFNENLNQQWDQNPNRWSSNRSSITSILGVGNSTTARRAPSRYWNQSPFRDPVSCYKSTGPANVQNDVKKYLRETLPELKDKLELALLSQQAGVYATTAAMRLTSSDKSVRVRDAKTGGNCKDTLTPNDQ